jgi:putative endonuclease
MNWFIYILECNDKTLYTGISTNVFHRVLAHNSGKGAKYTSSRRPVVLIYVEGVYTKSQALKRELYIKKQKRSIKIEIAKNLRPLTRHI